MNLECNDPSNEAIIKKLDQILELLHELRPRTTPEAAGPDNGDPPKSGYNIGAW